MIKILQYSEEKINNVSEKFKRSLFNDIDKNTNKIIGIVWVRWIWKTTILLQIAKKREKSVYFSMDASFLKWKTIFELVEELKNEYWIINFFIDEIHKYKNWEQDLKTIYDFFDWVKIIFSWSSSIDLIKWNYDLSRRGKLFKLDKFSFREYLELKYAIQIDWLSIDDLINNSSKISFELYKKHNNIITLFKEYNEIGELWFSIIGEKYDYRDKLENIINKIIYEDISSFYNLKTENIYYFFDILKFIANSSPSQINYSNIAKLLKTTTNTVKSYVEILIEIWFLNAIWKEWKISIQLRKTKKIYFELVNFLDIFFDDINQSNYIWTIRESIVASILKKHGIIYYPEKWDILFIYNNTKYIFEIWWSNKKNKQIKDIENSFLIKDDINFWEKNQIPIWLLGFLD